MLTAPSWQKSDSNRVNSESDWNGFYQRFFPLVLATVRVKMGWDYVEAQNVAHEIVGIAIQNVKDGRFSGESSLGTYVYAITRNQIFSRIKKENRRKEVSLHSQIPSPSDPIDLVEKEERRALIAKAISSLKPHHQEVVYRRFYDGMRVGEISNAMGIPPKKVSELLHYSLKKLRASLQDKIS